MGMTAEELRQARRRARRRLERRGPPIDLWAKLLLRIDPFNFRSPPPPSPTAAVPGTPGKIDEMARRYRRGESLYHPADAKADDPDIDRLATANESNGHQLHHRGFRLSRNSDDAMTRLGKYMEASSAA